MATRPSVATARALSDHRRWISRRQERGFAGPCSAGISLSATPRQWCAGRRNSHATVDGTPYAAAMPGSVLAIGGLSPDHDEHALHRYALELSGVAHPRQLERVPVQRMLVMIRGQTTDGEDGTGHGRSVGSPVDRRVTVSSARAPLPGRR